MLRGDAIRMLDACCNRAQEALRTLEDLARFSLDDAHTQQGLKSVRHAIIEIRSDLVPRDAQRLSWRDTPGDVGTRSSTPGEQSRDSLFAIAEAASARASQALRTIEEMAKLHSPEVAARAETIRYRTYELSQRVALALAGGRAREWRLCVLISEALCTHHPWEQVAQEAIAGGAECLQLREKSLNDRALLERARAMVALARPHGVSVIVNDRPDIALAAGCDGVHLGQEDMSVRDVRAIAGDALLVGVSCSGLEQAREASREGADYLGLGPIFPSTTKVRGFVRGVDLVREVVQDPACTRLPHLAISGIHAGNVRELGEAGCRGVAVSSAVCSSEDPRGACEAILAALEP